MMEGNENPYTNHRKTLETFLRTDNYRLLAALEEAIWDAQVAQRLTDHLRFALQLRSVFLEGVHPKDSSLADAVNAIAPTSLDEALDLLDLHTSALIEAIQRVDDARLHAPVLDPAERNLTVLGHLYDFCRANAMLVEWARAFQRPTSNL